MHLSSLQDYVSISFPGQGGGSYNNSKQWRRQSCWRKWKQLSRLQRSLILFILVFLFICGIASYPTVTEHLRGLTDGKQDTDSNSILEPFVPLVLPEPAKQGPPPLPEQPSQRKVSNRRGPPVLQNRLQKKGNASEIVVEDKAADSKKEDEEKKVISWRGAVIDTDEATEGTKNGENKEDSPANQEVKTSTDLEFSWLEAVREAFRHAWKGYKEFAWGHDELRPISKSYSEWFGLGLTLIDALDTMWILELKEEFEEAKSWVATELTFNKNVDVNLFESTIRILGGLLSTYHLTGDTLFLDKAVSLHTCSFQSLRH